MKTLILLTLVIVVIWVLFRPFTKKELYIVDYKEYSYYYSAVKKFIIDSKNGKVKKKINKAFRISKNFSEEKIVSQTQSLYEQLL